MTQPAEPLIFKSYLSQNQFTNFIQLLDFQHLNTSTGRDTILNFLEERTFYGRKTNKDFNLYHPLARSPYFRIIAFLQAQWLIDTEKGFGRRTENLNLEFNHALQTLLKAKEDLIDAYKPDGSRFDVNTSKGTPKDSCSDKDIHY